METCGATHPQSAIILFQDQQSGAVVMHCGITVCDLIVCYRAVAVAVTSCDHQGQKQTGSDYHFLHSRKVTKLLCYIQNNAVNLR